MQTLFDLPIRSNKATDKSIAKKSKEKIKSASTIRGTKSISQKIQTMKDDLEKYLGDKRDSYKCIRTESELEEYITACIDNGIVAIDTETTGLNPLECEIVGFSLYTPKHLACYVPLNHKSYISLLKCDNQLSIAFVKEQLSRLIENNTKTVWFNAKFDIRVIKHSIGVKFVPYFCAYVASRLLNENEPERGLKALHKKYVLDGKEDAFSYGQLFKDLSFDLVPIDTAYLYAARDAQVTFELYDFQLPYLTSGSDDCKEQELEGVQNIFWNIEMPIISIVADMEDRGVNFDFNKQSELSERYHKLQDDAETAFYEELKKYTDNTYSISSNKQLAELFYDELKIMQSPKKGKQAGKKPVDEEALKGLDHPLVKIILDYRGYAKLISTYIDKMAECARIDGRVHGEFNQVGTDTGRFSSNDPNLQNIPSKNAEIRTMFRASDGYTMLSSDYSAQEPRLTACMANDERMIYEYNNGIDPYVTLASIAYDLPYDECCEFRKDGTVNKDGKKRRKKAKVILLGITYGAGLQTVAEGLGVDVKKAEQINNKVFDTYKNLLPFKEASEKMARERGYVTTYWGRKRRLPDINLPEYEFKSMDTGEDISDADKNRYIRILHQKRGYKKPVFEQANREGIYVIDNTSKIALAERQCVNARIQGSAADMTKIAMINIATNKRLNELGFKMLLQVHDELIGECPDENVEECSKLFQQCMVDAAKDLPILTKTDVTAMKSWDN